MVDIPKAAPVETDTLASTLASEAGGFFTGLTNELGPLLSFVIGTMAAPAKASPSTAPVTTPAVNGPSTIDTGDFAVQFLESIAPIAAQALGLTAEAAISTLPCGTIITAVLGPQTLSNYISQGLSVLEAHVAAGNVVVNPANFVESTAAALFNANEAKLAAYLGNAVGPMISALVAKIKL